MACRLEGGVGVVVAGGAVVVAGGTAGWSRAAVAVPREGLPPLGELAAGGEAEAAAAARTAAGLRLGAVPLRAFLAAS